MLASLHVLLNGNCFIPMVYTPDKQSPFKKLTPPVEVALRLHAPDEVQHCVAIGMFGTILPLCSPDVVIAFGSVMQTYSFDVTEGPPLLM
tara:strand:+ start:118 stop:387 length:270 start_codon:yes stop_codon:yes gene_type:complete